MSVQKRHVVVVGGKIDERNKIGEKREKKERPGLLNDLR